MSPEERGPQSGTDRAPETKNVAVIGAGPAGLIAAETLARAGVPVTVYERMPNPGRKFLLAGRGGLNLTHSEPLPAFLARYGPTQARLRSAIEAFPPAALRRWCEGLGEPTFIGSSGRVFPKCLKASPLLRAWLRRLSELGVRLERGQHWQGWTASGALAFASPDQAVSEVWAHAVVLALGGASWPRLGADGGWAATLRRRGIEVAPLAPANCGVQMAWSQVFRDKFAGEPLKRITASAGGLRTMGEAVVTARGLEGGAIYPLVPSLRASLAAGTPARLTLDLRPDLSSEAITERLTGADRKQSLANRLRKSAGLGLVATSLLREPGPIPTDTAGIVARIKELPLTVTALEPLARAISTAGGIAWSELDEHFMLQKLPGVFAAGEMLDWEAPTGGYLLQACFSTGVAAATGTLAYLARAT